ncbi:MAG: comEC [Bacteroidetes bacterium]|nr:comEC [Bacteroidota bacterium]
MRDRMVSVRNFPAFRLSVLLAIGILAGNALELSIQVFPVILFSLLLLVLLLIFLGPRSTLGALISVSVSLLCIAFGAAKLAFDRDQSLKIPHQALESETVAMGTVNSIPLRVPNGVRFVMRTSSLVIDGASRPFVASVLVSVMRLREENDALRHGNRVAVKGELMRPVDERNPGEFSERQYYEANGISLLMRSAGKEHLVVLDPSEGSWLMTRMVEPTRRYIISTIDASVGGEEGEFLKGLLIGERGGISPSTRRAFTNAGVAHVLAVSGSNVAVVAGILFVLIGFFPFPRWGRFVVTGLGVLFYMVLTGSQPPVVRATIMALVILAAGAFQEKRNPFNALGFAACIILLVDARQLFDVGFQLSFAAVLFILALYPKVNSWISCIRSDTLSMRGLISILRVGGVSAVATLGTFPLTALYFGKVSIIGVVANVLVLPMVAASVALGCAGLLAGLVSSWLAGVYGSVNHLLLSLTLTATNIAGNLPLAYVDSVRFTAIHAVPFYMLLLLIISLRKSLAFRVLTMSLLVSMNVMIFTPDSPAYAAQRGVLRVSVIDVGQGDAILVEFPDNKTMLVDAGPKSLSFDAGDRIVAPFLRRRAITTIDLLLVSHPHSDHLGGVPALLEQFDVKRVVDNGQAINTSLYARYLTDVRNERCRFESAQAGMVFQQFEGVRMYILAPTNTGMDSMPLANLNNTSVACKLQYGSVSFLLPGDAEEEAEKDMAGVYGDFLRADVLKAGHHGSSTSSTTQFLEVVRPGHVVISVGRRNKFGHPAPSVVERFAALNTHILRTDDQGAVIFQTDGLTLTRIDWR